MTGPRSYRRVIVTGAGGFLGSHCVNYYRQQGVDTVGISRRRGETVDIIAKDDLADAVSQAVVSNSLILHMAGCASVSHSLSFPIEDFHANLVTLMEILEVARHNDAAVFFPSSGAASAREDRVQSFTPYAASKRSGEAYCLAYSHSFELHVFVGRLFSVFGPGMGSFAISDFVRRIEANPSRLELLDDGTSERDYLYVDDVVRAIDAIVQIGQPRRIYDVGSGESVSVREIAARVATAMGKASCRIELGSPVDRIGVRKMVADTGFLSSLGFHPQVTLDDGLLRTVESLTSHTETDS